MRTNIYFIFCLTFLWSCASTPPLSSNTDDGKIEINFLQINDVYEIAPLPGDNRGGMARIATLKKQLEAEGKITYSIMAGDFLSPSVIGTLDDKDGNGIKGAHMIDVMNAAGIDLATFGNHEFDLKEKDLQKRLDESEFQWVSSNVLQVDKGDVSPFYKNANELRKKKEYIPETFIKTFTDADGTKLTIGFFSVTLDVQQPSYVAFEDYMQRAKLMTEQLYPKVDLIIPVTHLHIEDDLILAKEIPKFPLIMGGHEHYSMRFMVGSTVVAKADANAKTAFVHTLKFDRKEKTFIVYSELVKVDGNIPEDELVKEKVDYWKKIAWDDMLQKGFQPDEMVTQLKDVVDGTEHTVRAGQCDLGKMVTDAMREVCKNKVDAVLINSGSIRVDDMLKGKLTQYDIIRILPYATKVIEVEMTGALLKKILEASAQNRGEGAYLQLNGIAYDETSLTFKIGNELLQADKTYRIGMNDFLLAGYDFKFLTKETEGILNIEMPAEEDKNDLRNDLRKAVIASLQKSKP